MWVLCSIHLFNIIVMLWKNSTSFIWKKESNHKSFWGSSSSTTIMPTNLPPKQKKIEQRKGSAFQKIDFKAKLYLQANNYIYFKAVTLSINWRSFTTLSPVFKDDAVFFFNTLLSSWVFFICPACRILNFWSSLASWRKILFSSSSFSYRMLLLHLVWWIYFDYFLILLW